MHATFTHSWAHFRPIVGAFWAYLRPIRAGVLPEPAKILPKTAGGGRTFMPTYGENMPRSKWHIRHAQVYFKIYLLGLR